MGGCVYSKHKISDNGLPEGTLFRKRPVLRSEPPMRVFEQWIHDKSSLFSMSISKPYIDTVNKSLRQQHALPEDCLRLLDSYLATLPEDFNFAAKINAVSDQHAHDLSVSADMHQFAHHDLPHALEIEWRTMNALKYLGLWQTETRRDAFFRASIACMVRLHDHEQIHQHLSPEEITAKRIITWLNSALNLPTDKTAVTCLIQFMAYRIIVCGTTMIYSPTRIMDLSELLFALEQLKHDKHSLPFSEFNRNLIQQMNLVMILTGINDKCPGASLLNVLEQLKQSRYAHEMPVLDTFFLSHEFKAYYDVDRLRDHYNLEGFADYDDEYVFFKAVNKQAFLLMIVPHIAMRPELLEPTDANRTKLCSFINQCRSTLYSNPDAFKIAFEEAFVAYDVLDIMQSIFFEQINHEAGFIRSLEGWLTEMAETYLPGTGTVCPNMIALLVDPRIPSTDALNVEALKDYYDALTPENKIILCQELMMTVILQAGTMKALELDLREEPSLNLSVL